MNSIIQTPSQALEHARKLISSAQIEDAINLLITLSKKRPGLNHQVLGVSAKFNNFKSRKIFGELSEQDIEVKRGAITYSLLEIIGDLEKVIQRDDTPEGKSIEEMIQAGAKIQKNMTSTGGKAGIGNAFSIAGDGNHTTLNIKRKFLFTSLLFAGVILALLYFWPQIGPPTTTISDSDQPYPEFLGKWETIGKDKSVRALDIGENYLGTTGDYSEGHYIRSKSPNGKPKVIYIRKSDEKGYAITLKDENVILFEYTKYSGITTWIVEVEMKRVKQG